MYKDKQHQIRFDFQIIAKNIKPNSKVLDIGCGNGELLTFLKKNKNIDGRGLDISASDVSKALAKGISVIHGDAENDLCNYPDNSFDYAVLSQTIQAMKDPKEVLHQMLRIAKYIIISLPNFAYFKNRLYLLFKGKMPVSETLPYQWYNTPNIHFCSIKDFEILCQEMNFEIINKSYITSSNKVLRTAKGIFANFFAEYGIFLITRSEVLPAYEQEFTRNAKLLLAAS